MQSITLKTTAYDILAYLLPGVVFNCAIFLIWLMTNPQNYSLLTGILSFVHLYNIPIWICFVFIMIVSYPEGILISTIGYLFVEKLITHNIQCFRYIGEGQIILNNKFGCVFPEDFFRLFGFSYSFEDKNLLVVWAQENSPATYATSFIFLVLYGLNRNMCAVFLIALSYLLYISFILQTFFSYLFFGILILISLFYAGYLHFRECYIFHLAATFITSQRCNRMKIRRSPSVNSKNRLSNHRNRTCS